MSWKTAVKFTLMVAAVIVGFKLLYSKFPSLPGAAYLA